LLVRLVLAAVVVYALYEALLALVNIRTNVLWYDSVDAGSVYGNILGAQVLLFAVFGILTLAPVVATPVVLIRYRPRFRPDPARHKWRARYLRVERRFRPWLIG